MKTCNKCNIPKVLDEFQKRNDTKSGFRTICKSCDRERFANWRSNNKEKTRSYKKKYRSVEENKTKEKEYAKIFASKKSSKELRSKRLKDRYTNDIIFRMKKIIRSLIRQSIRNKGFVKSSKTITILGCSIEEFKIYLESKFEVWMSWENYGKYNGELNYGWDIDHKIPASSALTVVDMIKLNHYTNLQPLCSRVNRDIKKDRTDY